MRRPCAHRRSDPEPSARVCGRRICRRARWAGNSPIIVNIQNAPAGFHCGRHAVAYANGGQQIDIKFMSRLIDETVANGIRGRESATHGAIKDTFGARDKM
jgi:hypothetical protein